MNVNLFKYLKSTYDGMKSAMNYLEENEFQYLLKKLLVVPIIMFISLLILIFYEFVKWLTS